MPDELRDTVADYYSRKHEMEAEIGFEQSFPGNSSSRSRFNGWYFSGIAACLLVAVTIVVQVQNSSRSTSVDSSQLVDNEELLLSEPADNPAEQIVTEVAPEPPQADGSVGIISRLGPDNPFDRLLTPNIDLFAQATDVQDDPLVGWCLVEFTITETGSVVDAVVVDGEPPGEFNARALDEISRFLFDPRIVDGVAVPVHNVQYVFKYRASSL